MFSDKYQVDLFRWFFLMVTLRNFETVFSLFMKKKIEAYFAQGKYKS